MGLPRQADPEDELKRELTGLADEASRVKAVAESRERTLAALELEMGEAVRMASESADKRTSSTAVVEAIALKSEGAEHDAAVMVGRCRMTLLWPRTYPAWFQRLNRKLHGPNSNFAFNCNLRHYMMEVRRISWEALRVRLVSERQQSSAAAAIAKDDLSTAASEAETAQSECERAAKRAAEAARLLVGRCSLNSA